jgi:hypothetical protein
METMIYYASFNEKLGMAQYRDLVVLYVCMQKGREGIGNYGYKEKDLMNFTKRG